MDTTPNIPSLFSVKGFSRKHPTFTEASLRWLIYNSHDKANGSKGEKIRGNGLEQSGAIIRVGRRIFVDEVLFFAWLKNGQSHQQPGTPSLEQVA